MNYYSFHIGDYIKQTVHLTALEDICYRRLLDMYYETEQPIPTETDRVSRRLRLDTELVDSVLKEFFTLTEKGWENERCEAEISAYHVKADTARSNGKLGGRPKKTQSVSNRNLPESGSKANQEPITKEIKEKEKKEKRASCFPVDFTINDTGIKYANERGVNITTELDGFRNYHEAKGTTFKDWQAAWRTWCDNAVKFGRASAQKADDKPKLDTSLEARRAAMQAQADESYKGRAWFEGEKRYRTVFKIEDGQIKPSRVYDSGVAA